MSDAVHVHSLKNIDLFSNSILFLVLGIVVFKLEMNSKGEQKSNVWTNIET